MSTSPPPGTLACSAICARPFAVSSPLAVAVKSVKTSFLGVVEVGSSTVRSPPMLAYRNAMESGRW